jgi:flavin reductase (DIM6/NTAB) family NADH-FMN oxidoreductase RutF
LAKKQLGNRPFLYPYPVMLVGTEVEGKANFVTIAFCGIVNMNPGMLTIGIGRGHHSTKGLLANRTFSVNIPSASMLEATDYCGNFSGSKVDKSTVFEVFAGSLPGAPLIKDCPINMECKVREVLDLGGNDLVVVAEIVETYADERYLTDGLPDVEKMQSVVFSMFDNRYWGLGPCLGRAWDVGKGYRSKS